MIIVVWYLFIPLFYFMQFYGSIHDDCGSIIDWLFLLSLPSKICSSVIVLSFKWENLLNLSTLLSGGIETKLDSQSNGKWNESCLIQISNMKWILPCCLVSWVALWRITSLIKFVIWEGYFPVCLHVTNNLQLCSWVVFFRTRVRSVWWYSHKIHNWW